MQQNKMMGTSGTFRQPERYAKPYVGRERGRGKGNAFPGNAGETRNAILFPYSVFFTGKFSSVRNTCRSLDTRRNLIARNVSHPSPPPAYFWQRFRLINFLALPRVTLGNAKCLRARTKKSSDCHLSATSFSRAFIAIVRFSICVDIELTT